MLFNSNLLFQMFNSYGVGIIFTERYITVRLVCFRTRLIPCLMCRTLNQMSDFYMYGLNFLHFRGDLAHLVSHFIAFFRHILTINAASIKDIIIIEKHVAFHNP